MCPARIGVDRGDYEADDGNDEEGGLGSWIKGTLGGSLVIGDDWIGGFRRPGEGSMEGFTEHGFRLQMCDEQKYLKTKTIEEPGV